MFFFRLILLSFFCFGVSINAQSNIYINQAGYKPEGFKVFYTDTDTDSFKIYSADNNEIIFEGEIEFSIENDPAAGINLFRGNFSELKTEGEYYIKINDTLSSGFFMISNFVYEDLLYKSLKGFYFWRCGTALESEFASPYTHAACHLNDGTFHSSTGKEGTKDATGGWHDAGDYGKYVVNAGITAGTLLMAYELFPDLFKMDNLNISESGNGIPDILDEVRYELEWLLKMQDENGGVYHKLTRTNFSGFIMPQTDRTTRYLYEISSTATADFTAVMAKAYRIFRAFDSSFAEVCLNAAEQGAEFLAQNPDIIPPGGFDNPDDTGTGEYGDGNDRDERLWAYCELYFSTNNEDHLNSFVLIADNYLNIYNAISWPNVAVMGFLTYIFSSEESDDYRLTLINSITNYCSSLLTKISDDGFNVTLNPGEYNWGSNSAVLNNAILLILGYELTGDFEYLQAAQYQLNYCLGTNFHNISFVTGVGTEFPMHIHHRPSAADGISEPVPGYIAGGPNQYLQDPALQENFEQTTPPAQCYIDDVDSYASNENAINWNAPLVFVSGYFNNIIYTTSVESNDINSLPNDLKLYQNYPNPFNGQTNIGFYLPENGNVVFKIFNILGELIYTRELGFRNKGENNINWTANDMNGYDVNSGVYFYEIEFQNKMLAKKFLYLK